MNKNNLNRIKGILSAKQGTQVPKFQKGNILYHKKTGKPIFRIDQSSNQWFTDENYQNLFNGNLNEFSENPITTIQGGLNTDVNAVVKTAAANNQQVQAQIQQTTNNAVVEETVAKQTRQERREERQQDRQDRRNEKRIEYQQKVDALNAQATPEREENWNKALNVMDGISQVGNAVGAAQMATDSDTTKTATAMYDGISSAMSNAGPYGKIVSGAMQAGKAIGDIAQWAGGGTDQMTKTDQWMDSPFFSWNVGLINGFAGKNTDSFSADQDILSQVGSSYGGSAANMAEASETADKKYGLFSSKARKKANDAIAKAKSDQALMGNIADDAADQRLLVSSMGEQAGLAYSMMTDGGYNQKYTYAAKQGGILEWEPEIKLEWEPLIELNWELPVFKDGGNIDFNEELEWIPELQKGNKIRTLEELIEYAKKENPRFVQRFSEKPRGIEFTDDEGNKQHGSHLLGYELDENGDAIVFPSIQEMEDGSLKYLSTWDAYNRSIENKNFLKMSPEEAKLFTKSGEDENGNLFGYKIGWPEFFKQNFDKNKFKKGGSLGDKDIPEIEETNQKNVIPEGALHKNKHHMEHAEGLTKKGIPVIDEEGEQQAEIEHSEIIFTLEVTKKLEEYYQIFYSDEATNKEKEQAALDTGKLLVYQILENTEDRTGLIESCKKGGSLTLKKSTDDLIEEVLEWMPTITIIEEIIEEPKETFKKDSKKELKKSEKEQMKEAIKEVLIEILTK